VAYFDAKERLVRIVECPHHAGIMSGGQWRRKQLASFMAWREMSTHSFPLLVMDEACTSMDTAGIQSVQQTLREWCEENDRRTCLFITHEPEQHRDTSIYQNHVRIVHKRGRASLVDTESREPKKCKT
jgi:ABC-type multidrug transport system ATPase subunit